MALDDKLLPCLICKAICDDFYNNSLLCMECYEGYDLCLDCGLGNRNKPHPWCTKCYKRYRASRTVPFIASSAPPTVLQQADRSSEHYKKAAATFVSKWDTRKGPCPDVSAVYFINNDGIRKRFSQYSDGLKANGKHSNEQQHFHGTVLACDLLSNDSECNNTECGICGIARNGFDENRIGTNIPRFQRFGNGMYLAPNSSKCHDYTQGAYSVRAMLLCTVAMGQLYSVTQDQTALLSPPTGYDSVHGQHSPNGALNYDEVVLYTSDAILPTHVIVYAKDGIGKIAK